MKKYSSNTSSIKFQSYEPNDTKIHAFDVVIVGSGPVGLTLALEMKKQNIKAIIITNNNFIPDGSKAICISRESMETFQSLGVADKISSIGLGWVNGKSFYKNEKVFELKMPDNDNEKYKPMTNLQQSILEEILIKECLKQKIEIRWNNQITDILKNDNNVQLEVKSLKKKYKITSKFLLAADGAKSKIRENLGLKLEGESYSGNYLISDIKIKLDYPTERLAFFYPSSNPEGTALMHKQPFDIWRIDYSLENQLEKKTSTQDVKNMIQDHLNSLSIKKKWELVWWSQYKAHCLSLKNFVHNRVIFCGDAAHLVPIFGVKGLNSGIADAHNIGWKLPYILNNKKPLSFLRTYDSERKKAITNIFNESKKSTLFMSPPTNGYKLMQNAVLSLSIKNSFYRSLINPRQSKAEKYDFEYKKFSYKDKSNFKIGQRLKNIKLTKGFLFDFIPNSYFILNGQNISIDHNIHSINIRNNDYGNFIYLVRPDKYIVYIWNKLNITELDKIVYNEIGFSNHGKNSKNRRIL